LESVLEQATGKAHMAEIAASASPGTDIQKRDLRALGLVIIFGIFATTMAQPQVLG